ncbi:hypothetical protein JCM10207_005358 [Rhodosporidiobolus poonsookiae]
MAGFAFVEFDQLRDAEQAVQELNNKDFLGERILVEFAKPPRAMMDDRFGGPPRGYGGGGYGGGGYGGGGYGGGGYGGGYGGPPPRNPPARPGNGYRLTISNLRDGTSWQDLKDFGRQVGSVSFADVDRRDPSIGFIEFGSRRDADEAIDRLSGKECNGAIVTVAEDRDAGPPRSRYDERDDRDRGYSSRGGRDDRDRGYRSGRDRTRSPPPARERSRSRSPRRERSPRRSRSPAPREERDRSMSPRRD